MIASNPLQPVTGGSLRFVSVRFICGHRKHPAVTAFLARRRCFCATVIFFRTVSLDFASRYSHPPFDAEVAFFRDSVRGELLTTLRFSSLSLGGS
jgi:hypothetical protein